MVTVFGQIKSEKRVGVKIDSSIEPPLGHTRKKGVPTIAFLLFGWIPLGSQFESRSVQVVAKSGLVLDNNRSRTFLAVLVCHVSNETRLFSFSFE